MSATIDVRVQNKRDTTANWNRARGFIPFDGEIIIYTDYQTVQKEIDGQTKNVYIPGVKVGDGRAYVQDLPFVDEELRSYIMGHINNPNVHVSEQDRNFWNNKLNVNDASEVINEELIFNRN